MTDLRCPTCRYWEKTISRAYENEDEQYGVCHRHAPQPGVRDITWPRVSAAEWCGDHETRED